jgi:deoxyribodipyrimidine photo-lyase
LTFATRLDPARVRSLRDGEIADGPVLYWMRRDQRVRDNWALLYAQDAALARGRPLAVTFCLVPEFLGAASRQYRFLLAGLREVARELASLRIPFSLLQGDPVREVPALVAGSGAGLVVTDFNPLRLSRQWEEAVCARVTVPVRQVDAHNVVPVWQASDKHEYAARTLRPKLHRLLPRFLTEMPALQRHPHPWPQDVAAPDWDGAQRGLAAADHGPPLDWCEPGEAAAQAALTRFLDERLAAYDTARNDPTLAGQSDLSPYLHFGQLAPQRAALAAAQHAEPAGRAAFLEELIVRRELSDNHCHHEHDYDRYEGLPAWGRRTLEDHLDDPREHVYDLAQFAAAATHDPLWNAAQTEMMVRGKMHGYLRMYWAKKILEWTPDPATALDIAITLNDRYSLDGRDPNGYVGCAWSIGGLHDRPWTERAIFGKIRYMNFAGCKRKFRVDRYLDRIARLVREAGA